MNFLILISFRNLLRQKRRNLLLGAAMAIGMALLVIAHAFSHGISDVMFNRILTYVTGHVSVAFTVKGNYNQQVFRDGPRMLELARKAVPDAGRIEEAVGVFTRVVGAGRSDNVILVGLNMRVEATAREKAEMASNFPMLSGKLEDVLRDDLENPVVLADEKAKYLGLKPGDMLRARFQDVYGRNQAVRLTVAGIFKPANIFMTAPVFMDLPRLKVLAGYGPNDIAGFQVTLPDPKRRAIPAAESLHAALKPSLAAAYGTVSFGPRSRPATVLGFRVDTASLRGVARLADLPAPRFAEPGVADTSAAAADTGTPADGSAFGSRSILAGPALADSLGLRPGMACTLAYAAKRGGHPARAVFRVTHILPRRPDLPDDLLLVGDRDFYAFYYGAWPVPARKQDGAFLPDSAHALRPFLSDEWVLMERTATTQAMQAKYREATRLKTRATLVDVQTMYESASMIVNVETALNLITLVAVLILFFIIQVGVVNTLRMTIRERTREIGTMRAIGMRRQDVRAQLLLETLFLSLAAAVAGLLMAFAGMWALRQLHFGVERNPMAMILVDGRIHFLPTLAGTLAYVALILIIAALTAWFPARRAANLSPTEALRHFG